MLWVEAISARDSCIRKRLNARMARISACQSCRTVPLARRVDLFAGKHFMPVLQVDALQWSEQKSSFAHEHIPTLKLCMLRYRPLHKGQSIQYSINP